jgi:hypothetical protein
MTPLLYHHCRELVHTRYDLVVPWRVTQALPEPAERDTGTVWDDWSLAEHMEASYRWLAQRVGFWPLWLAVGASDEDRRMSGYQLQWRRQSETANNVLFSWARPPTPTLHYLCYGHWHIVLNSVYYQGRYRQPDYRAEVEGMTPQLESWVMHPRRQPRDWLRAAASEPHSVQAVVPLLDLRTADVLWCRNQAARKQLCDMGFAPERVLVRRLLVD